MENIKQPTLRFKEFSGDYKKFKIKDTLDLAIRPLKMKNDEIYSLVTVKRRGVGIEKREQLSGEKIKVKTQFYLKTNDYVISKRQIVHGAFGIVPKELNNSIVSNEYNVLTPKNNCNLIYFNYLSGLTKMKKSFFLSSDGVHIEKMLFKTNDWMKRIIILPPLPEQQKIASFLSSVDSKIKKLENKKALLDEYKRGIMQKIFSQEIRFRGEGGKEYPDWVEKKLGEITRIYDGTHQTPKYVEEGIPFYSVEHVTANQFTSTKYISKDIFDKENKRVTLEKGDILMTRIGSIGEVKYIDWDVEASFYVSLALIKQDKSYNGKYLNFLIQSDFFQRELWKKTIHVAFPKKINLGEIGKCHILLPCLKEQEKIANFLSGIDKKIELVKQETEQVKEFKRGLLQQMFV